MRTEQYQQLMAAVHHLFTQEGRPVWVWIEPHGWAIDTQDSQPRRPDYIYDGTARPSSPLLCS